MHALIQSGRPLFSEPPQYISIPEQDQKLIDLTIERGFNIQRLLNRCDDAHPAQRSFVTLTHWRKQPHIAAILDQVIKDMEQWDLDADKYRNRDARDGLAEAAYRAQINIRRLEESSDESKQHTRAIEEFRLANQALYRATKPPAPPKTPRLTKAQKLNQELEAKPTPKAKQPNPRDIPINYAEVIAKYAAEDAAAAAAQEAADQARRVAAAHAALSHSESHAPEDAEAARLPTSGDTPA